MLLTVLTEQIAISNKSILHPEIGLDDENKIVAVGIGNVNPTIRIFGKQKFLDCNNKFEDSLKCFKENNKYDYKILSSIIITIFSILFLFVCNVYISLLLFILISSAISFSFFYYFSLSFVFRRP